MCFPFFVFRVLSIVDSVEYLRGQIKLLISIADFGHCTEKSGEVVI